MNCSLCPCRVGQEITMDQLSMWEVAVICFCIISAYVIGRFGRATKWGRAEEAMKSAFEAEKLCIEKEAEKVARSYAAERNRLASETMRLQNQPKFWRTVAVRVYGLDDDYREMATTGGAVEKGLYLPLILNIETGEMRPTPDGQRPVGPLDRIFDPYYCDQGNEALRTDALVLDLGVPKYSRIQGEKGKIALLGAIYKVL